MLEGLVVHVAEVVNRGATWTSHVAEVNMILPRYNGCDPSEGVEFYEVTLIGAGGTASYKTRRKWYWWRSLCGGNMPFCGSSQTFSDAKSVR
ncbi:hypothetical protein CsSME_00035918 [Camellia sinensis var. sinensis]